MLGPSWLISTAQSSEKGQSLQSAVESLQDVLSPMQSAVEEVDVDELASTVASVRDTLNTKVQELHNQAKEQTTALYALAREDKELAVILSDLEGQREQVEGLRERVLDSRAASEVMKGKQAIGDKLAALMNAPEIENLVESGNRLVGRVMAEDSVARRKSDLLVKTVAIKVQQRLLQGAPTNATITAMIERVEKDLVSFIMQQHAKLTSDDGAALEKLKQELSGETWDPRMQVMVSFLRDVTKFSLEEAMSHGLASLSHWGTKGAVRIPTAAISRLENTLLAVLDQSGGEDAVRQLGAFWNQVEEGRALEAVATPCSQAAKSGLEGALRRIDEDAPEEVKQWLGDHARGEDGKLSLSKALDTSVDMLNSEAIVSQVQGLVGQGAGVLGQLETLKEDTMFQAALATLTSEEMENKLVQGLEDLDPELLVQDAELALTDLFPPLMESTTCWSTRSRTWICRGFTYEKSTSR